MALLRVWTVHKPEQDPHQTLNRTRTRSRNKTYAEPYTLYVGALRRHMMASKRCGARLSRMPSASLGDMFLATVKKGKPELRKKARAAGTSLCVEPSCENATELRSISKHGSIFQPEGAR